MKTDEEYVLTLMEIEERQEKIVNDDSYNQNEKARLLKGITQELVELKHEYIEQYPNDELPVEFVQFGEDDGFWYPSEEFESEYDGDWLFSIHDFNKYYPSLDAEKENDAQILKIKENLSGSPKYKEYTSEYIKNIKDLFDRYPNMKPYEHLFIPDERLLDIKLDRRIRMPNILLYGSPSCGKSSFTNQFCEIYGNYHRTSLGNGSVSFTLMGNDKGYNKSECGDILRSLFKQGDAPIANPIVILDEIDKANYGTGRDTDLSGTFSILLEKANAKNFADNFFKVEVDASHINYIAIANDISKIPEHVLSRFPIKIAVRDYTEEELKNIVFNNQYHTWIEENAINPNCIPPELPKDVKNLIYECSHGHPREVPAVLDVIAASTIYHFSKSSIATFRPNQEQENIIRNAFLSTAERNKAIGFSI